MWMLKPDSHYPKIFGFFYLIDSPLKVIKNDFSFILKGIFVLKIFEFLSSYSGQVEKTAWSERLG